jgi:hypothetical protein
MRLRLPWGFRLPYYGFLALFFLYPAALGPQVGEPDGNVLRWGLFGFSPVAGLLFLTLVPAIRRGANYVAENGSPWPWPWYPWILFVAVGLGVCWRAYYLCISFHAVVGSRTIFDLYFLAPLLWAVAYLSLEAWTVSGHKWAKAFALALPLATVAMALTASPNQQLKDVRFLNLFHNTLHVSPLFLALSAAAAFYLVAWLRRASGAIGLCLLTVAGFTLCGPDTFNPDTMWGPHGWPILPAGIVLLLTGAWRGGAWRCLMGGWCLVLTPWIDFRETPFAGYGGAIPIHLLVLCMLVVGAAFRNAAGRVIQNVGAMVLLGFALIVSLEPPESLGRPPELILAGYPLAIAALAAVYGFLCKNPWYFAAVLGSLGGWVAKPGWSLYSQSRRSVAGMDYIVGGIASFLLAFLVSLTKMKSFNRPSDRRRPKE